MHKADEGVTFKPMAVKRFPIEAGHVMMFARSIGDPNPVYFDETYAHRE